MVELCFLAFEVCWSRGPDGIRCSDDLRNILEGIRSFSQYSGSGYTINGGWKSGCQAIYKGVSEGVIFFMLERIIEIVKLKKECLLGVF